MAQEEHLAILKQGVQAWNNWRIQCSVIPNLSEADLSRMDLRGINFSYTNLHKTNLQECYLNHAQLIGAHLVKSFLSKVECYETNFNKANLTESNCSMGSFVHSFFMEACLYGSDLSRANFLESDLRHANLEKGKLCETNLMGTNLSGVRLVEANLFKAKLYKANLIGKANLFKSNLTEAELCEANFTEADLSEAVLSKTNCCRTIFSMAILRKAVLIKANLGMAILNNVDLTDSNLTQAQLDGANLIQANLKRANLSEASLSRSDLEFTNFQDADLTRTNLSRALAVATNFQKANLTGACIENWNVSNSKLNEVNCDYIFLKIEDYIRNDRQYCFPFNREFDEGEFGKLFKADRSYNRLSLLEKLIDNFETVLDNNPDGKESLFHDFLKENPIILDIYANKIISKPVFNYPQGEFSPLGKTYVEPDFIIMYPGQEYTLVELERPKKAIGTKLGHPTSEFTQASFQLAEWEHYIKNYPHLLKDKFPGIADHRSSILIISRREKIGETRLDRGYMGLISNHFPHKKVYTYDDLLDKSKQAFKSLVNLRL